MTRTVPLLAALVFYSSWSAGLAQGDAAAGDDAAAEAEKELSDAVKKRIATMVDRQRAVVEERMQITYAYLNRVCDLSNDQAAKLTLATKGAIEDNLSAYRKQMEQRYAQRRKPLAAAVANAKAVAAEAAKRAAAANEAAAKEAAARAAAQAKAREAAAQAAMVRASAFGVPVRKDVAREPRWTKTLDQVLTGEQQETYEAALTKRAADQRRLLAETSVSLIDDQVLLDHAQREALLKLTVRVLQEEPIEFPVGRNAYSLSSQYVLPTLVAKSSKDIDNLLDKTQLPVWKKFAARYARRLVAPGAARPAFRLAPALNR